MLEIKTDENGRDYIVVNGKIYWITNRAWIERFFELQEKDYISEKDDREINGEIE
jgi:hypothetical protein